MIVSELIELLKTKPQHLPVAYRLYSEQELLNPDQIRITDLCEPRADGWVENQRPDKPTRTYLVLPGD
jgi:hypothetical protein